MSLLLKALQNAAKNREEGTPADPATPPIENRPDAGAELTLEPLESGPRTGAPRSASNSADEVAERSTMSSQQHAQNVLRAGAPRPATVRTPGLMDWLARRPLVAFSTAAGLFAIGYGIYLYIQISNPGMFVARPVATPAPPPSPLPTASAPAAPAPPVPELAPQPQAGGTLAPTASLPPETTTPPASSEPPPSLRTAAGQPSAPAPRPPAATAVASMPAPSASPAGASAPPAAPAPAPRTTTAAPQSLPSRTAATEIASASPSSPVTAAVPGRETPPAAKPRATARAPVAPPARTPAEPVPSTGQVVAVDPGLVSAYQALEQGRLDDAERMYRQALASDPRSIDAMLGLAAALTQQNKADAATQLYMRVLEQDPRNALAQAGLLNIGGRADPAAAETRLKQLIAREPSAYLYFSLGNLYAEQRQWAAAQGAYFQAFNLAPDNPDYAFNLAVGLEHLSQPKLALDYYRKAVALAQARGNAQFALAPVQTRIRSIEALLAERP